MNRSRCAARSRPAAIRDGHAKHGACRTIALTNGGRGLRSALATLACGAALAPVALHAEPLARAAPVAGSIIRTEITARGSLVWTNERCISARLTANYVGPAWGGYPDSRLSGYTLVNAGLQWEPFDKAVEVRLDLFNLLEADFRTTEFSPGPGRAVSGSVLVRF